MPGERHGTLALDVLMERISDHLDALASKVLEVEEALGQTIYEPANRVQDTDAITRLQSLDFLRQSLEDLALLSCSISNHVRSIEKNHLPVKNIVESIKLDSTKKILGDAVLFQNLPADSGELDLF